MFIFEKKEESTAMENFTITDLENESIFNNLIFFEILKYLTGYSAWLLKKSKKKIIKK